MRMMESHARHPSPWFLAAGILAAIGGNALADCPSTALRWSSSSNRIYVSGAVACTLTDLAAFRPAQVTLVDAAGKKWLVSANVFLQNGATLLLHGDPVGGDVNELRLLSNDSSSSTAVVIIRADWGTLDIDSTKITSWDTSASGPDTKPSSNHRAYIHVRSSMASDGVTPQESRMDIRNSDIGYLGYDASESYGLVWKVVGPSPGDHSLVHVYGDVTGSRIHNNYFGAYTYGAFGMTWSNNELDHNVKYGLDPHDDSNQLTIENNNSHDNGNHGIICSIRCTGLTIRNNVVHDNTGNGIMLHRGVHETLVEDNEAYNNSDSGIAIFDSYSNTIQGNYLHNNGKGMRFSVGAADNLMSGNTIQNNSSYALYFYKGSDTPTSGNGHPARNRFEDNTISGNGQAVKLSEADDNVFAGNTFASNKSGFLLEDGQDNVFDGNTIPATSLISTTRSSLSSANTIVQNAAGPLLVSAESGTTTTFIETASLSHYIAGRSLASTVTPTQSTLVLDSSQIGSSTTVSAAPIYADPASGTLLLTPSGAKSWSARSASGTLSVSFQVGGLTPGASYTVLRNGAVFAQLAADGSGNLSFSDSVGTGSVSYLVTP
jgi:parallel beta-helix repeat protein